MIKSSDILKEALRLYINDTTGNIEGCCDAISFATIDLMGNGLYDYWKRVDIAKKAKVYLNKHRPEQFDIYWWPIEDSVTRIDVLNKCILDAIEAGD